MKEIFVNHRENKTQIAVREGGELSAYYSSQEDNPSIAGNIYKGRVQNIFPGMNAAFADIGRDKNVFFQFGSKQNIHANQSVILQVEKDATDRKNPRATLNISLAGQNLILLPLENYVGVSQKIFGSEKTRLLELAKKIRPPQVGVIVRTMANGIDEETFSAEFEKLLQLWNHIKERGEKRKPPALLFSDNDLIQKVIRTEFFDADIFLSDNLKIHRQAVELVKENFPELVDRVKFYDGDEKIFEHFGVDKEVKILGEREVKLPSGGFIVIDKTEALTAVDVNTGNFFGTDKLADTVYKTNLEAAKIILKQIRLRDICGIIIVDFIDMSDVSRREKLLEVLRDGARLDKNKTKIVDMTPLGLVEITRRHS